MRSVLRRFPGGAHAVLAAALLVVCVRNVAAHEIPSDVTVQALLKPEGQRLRLLVRVPLVAMRDMDYPTRGDKTPASSTSAGPNRCCATRRRSGWARRLTSTRATRGFRLQGSSKCAHRCRPTNRSPRRTTRRWRTSPGRGCRTTPIAVDPGAARRALRVPDSVGPVALLDRPAARPPRAPDAHGAAAPAARRRRAGVRVRRQPGFRAARSALAPGGAAVREARLPHILDGIDHLLFLFCLVIPFRRFRALVAVVTAFTVAHSITLIASAYNLAPDALWFPPLIETLIATSIVYMALENIVGTQSRRAAENCSQRIRVQTALDDHVRVRPRARLRVLVRAAADAAVRRLAPADVAAVVQRRRRARTAARAGRCSFRRSICCSSYVVAERMGTIILSALVAHTAWHWMTERAAILRQFRFEWPALDALFWASALRWMMLAVIAAGLYWLVFGVFKPQQRNKPSRESAVGAEEIS